MAKAKAKSAPKSKVEKVVEEEVVKKDVVIEEDKKVAEVIEKLEKVAPKNKVAPVVKESTTEDDIMEIKAYLTEASEMLMNLAKKLEKNNKSGNRFWTASKQIASINTRKIIV